VTIYYVSKEAIASDNNPGTYALPWSSLAKVNATAISNGSSVLFRRGDTWRENTGLRKSGVGTVALPVTFGAYGEGALPRIDHSIDLSSPSQWTNTGLPTNIWKATVNGYQIGQLLLDWNTSSPSAAIMAGRAGFVRGTGTATTILLSISEAALLRSVDNWYTGAYIYCYRGTHAGQNRLITGYIGSTKTAIVGSGSTWDASDSYFISGSNYDGMEAAKMFCWSQPDNCVYFNSPSGNPGSVYDGIVGAQRFRSNINSGSGLDGYTPAYPTSSFIVNDIEFTLSCDDCVLQVGINSLLDGCKFSWCGGEWDVENGYRDGYGIMYWTACNNIEVRNCTFYEIYNNAISWQYGHMDNHKIHHNIFINNGGGNNETWPQSATYSNFTIVHNTSYGNSQGVIGGQLESERQVYSEFFARVCDQNYGPGVYINCIVKNNICYSTSSRLRFFAYSLDNFVGLDGITYDYNCWSPDHTDCYKYNPNNLLDSLQQWQTIPAAHPDMNSTSDNPLFVDAANGDFRLQSDSPCKYEGTYLVGYSTRNPPSMGAFEYEDIPPEPPVTPGDLTPFRRT